jgi:predicted Zn-dependent peptidase
MIKFNYILLFVLVLVSLNLTFAQKETPPLGGEPKDFNLPPKSTLTLENGLKVTKVAFGNIPKVTVQVKIRTGNLNEAENEVWLADLTGDLLAEGTEKYSVEEIAQKAAEMGGEVNVGTGMDQTTISGSVLSEFGPELIALLAEIAQKPVFNESAIERIKKDLLRTLSIQKTQPQNVANEEFRKTLYPDHPYGRIYPTEEMINSYDQEKVKSFYENNFGAKRTHIFVSGMFNESNIDKAIKDNFSQWKEGNDIHINIPEAKSGKNLIISDRKDAPQSTIYLGLPVVDPSHPDYIKLSVTNTLLGGYFSSRVTSNIREDKGYTYSPYSQVSSRYRDSYYVQIADVSTDVTGAALKEIFYEINKLQDEAPASEELEGVQNYIAGIFTLQNSSRGAIINQLNYVDLHGLDDDYLNSYVKKIYSVTRDDIKDMADKYLKDDEMTLVIVGDEAKVNKQLSEYGDLKLVE